MEWESNGGAHHPATLLAIPLVGWVLGPKLRNYVCHIALPPEDAAHLSAGMALDEEFEIY